MITEPLASLAGYLGSILFFAYALARISELRSHVVQTQESPDMEIAYFDAHHLDAVLQIERDAFEKPWTRKQLREMTQRGGVVALIAMDRQQLVGFIIFEVQSNSIDLHNLAVAKSRRQQGIGSRLLDEAKQRLLESRPILRVVISERNLTAQLFYRAAGFRAEETLKDGDDELYMMTYRRTRGEQVNRWERVPEYSEEDCDGI